MDNPFFKNHGPFKIEDLLKDLKLNDIKNSITDRVHDIKDLQTSAKNHLTFFHSKKYHLQASNTKASYCLTQKI